jgi:serine/threonine-protein phosphatase 6 regulatory ankyrin repeat subunit B
MKKKAMQVVYIAFLIGCLVLVGLLTLSWGANEAELDLIKAAQKGDLAQVKSLIAAGVNVNVMVGDTALMTASEEGDVKVVQALLAAKADVNAKNIIGFTPLILTSVRRRVEVVRALLSAKADVNTQLAKGLGKGIRDFKKSLQGDESTPKQLEDKSKTEE